MNFLSYSIPSLLIAIIASACSEPSFTLKGEIQGAANTTLTLEKSDFHGRWIPIDSTHTDARGQFSISRPAPASPEIFRIALDRHYIYIPIDSTETISISSRADAFDTDFSLSGSTQAQSLENFEKLLIALPADISPDSLDAFKRRVYMEYLREADGSILSYYVLTKTRGDRFLFDPQDDYKYYAAVATAFRNSRPNDPHTPLLEQASIDAMRARNNALGRQRVIKGNEIRLIDISLPDPDGNDTRLSDITALGKPTVLIFSLMNQPESPAINARLREIFNRGGLNFYHVSLDPDQYAWRDAARNLPWTTVFDPAGTAGEAVARYNVSRLPVFYIYNAKGELSDRADDLDQLARKLR